MKRRVNSAGTHLQFILLVEIICVTPTHKISLYSCEDSENLIHLWHQVHLDMIILGIQDFIPFLKINSSQFIT